MIILGGFLDSLTVLDAQGNRLTQPFTIQFREKPMFPVEFCFINKYGMAEIFNANATKTVSLKTKKTVNHSYLPVVYTESDAEYTANIQDAYNEYLCEIGGLYQKDARELQSAFSSAKFYEIKNNQFLSCILQSDNFTVVKESADLCTVKFKYRRAFSK